MEHLYVICMDQGCDSSRVINFLNVQERQPHLKHIVHHIEDVKTSINHDEEYSPL